MYFSYEENLHSSDHKKLLMFEFTHSVKRLCIGVRSVTFL